MCPFRQLEWSLLLSPPPCEKDHPPHQSFRLGTALYVVTQQLAAPGRTTNVSSQGTSFSHSLTPCTLQPTDEASTRNHCLIVSRQGRAGGGLRGIHTIENERLPHNRTRGNLAWFHAMCSDSSASPRMWQSLSKKDGGAPVSPRLPRPPSPAAAATAAAAASGAKSKAP